MSLPSHPSRSRVLVIAACFLSTILAACAADGPVAPRPRLQPAFNGTDTVRPPCDSALSPTRCHPTQPWS